ncbi:MAG TPA: hypothetical protein VM597_06725, partial [Gemmataceae bacterium]|nr:hypothetical protein [Gemmataceae bacterium]
GGFDPRVAPTPVADAPPLTPPTLTPIRPADSLPDPTLEPVPQAAESSDFHPASIPSKTTPMIELAAGETIRHRMKTGQVIDRIKAGGRPVPMVEAAPDPTDAKRVLIKAGTRTGDSYLLLTDANGVQEAYTVRVK